MVARNPAVAYRHDAKSSDDIEMFPHALVGCVFRRRQEVMASAVDQPAFETGNDSTEVGRVGGFEGNIKLILVFHRGGL